MIQKRGLLVCEWHFDAFCFCLNRNIQTTFIAKLFFVLHIYQTKQVLLFNQNITNRSLPWESSPRAEECVVRLCIQEARDLLGSDWKLGVVCWWLVVGFL